MTGAGALDAEAEIEVEIEIESGAWLAALPEAEAAATRAARAALAHVGGGAAVILLTDDETVRDLNARFRGKDTPTNVLSFPAAPIPGGHGPAPLGDIALGFGVCAAEAGARGITLADHLAHLVIHGVLHLAGQDHEEDQEAERMEALEGVVLAGLGIADPYAAERAASAVEAAPTHG